MLIELISNWKVWTSKLAITFLRLDANNFLSFNVPEEMIMSSRVIVEKVHKDFVVIDPGASNERVLKVSIDHGVSINA